MLESEAPGVKPGPVEPDGVETEEGVDAEEEVEDELEFGKDVQREFSSEEVPEEIRRKLEEQLRRRREEERGEEEVVTTEALEAYLKDRREKIWYHALHFLVFNVDDHALSKEQLYEQLKEVTSKSPIDPIQQHVFYFGLSPLLKLKLYDSPLLRYRAGVFKVAVNVDNLREVLERVGPPIDRRPVLDEEKVGDMIGAFLEDDFSDI
ncbi:MAG: hypothetical protein Kow0069_34850 [Promethearchaeota archaeon]